MSDTNTHSAGSARAVPGLALDQGSELQIRWLNACPRDAEETVSKGLALEWKGAPFLNLDFDRRLAIVSQAQWGGLPAAAAHARIKVWVGSDLEPHPAAPGAVADLLRFLLLPDALSESRAGRDFVRRVLEIMGDGQLRAGPDRLREIVLPALVGPDLAKLYGWMSSAELLRDDKKARVAIRRLMHESDYAIRLCGWIESSRAHALIALMLALDPPVEDFQRALHQLTGKSTAVERLRVLPPALVTELVHWMPTNRRAGQMYVHEILPAVKAARQSLAAQSSQARLAAVQSLAWTCNRISHVRACGKARLGLAECTALRDPKPEVTLEGPEDLQGIEIRHVVRMLRMGVDALCMTRHQEERSRVQGHMKAAMLWMGSLGNRINRDLLRQARLPRLAEEALLWVRTLASAEHLPWGDALAAHGAVRQIVHARTLERVLFEPIQSDFELLRAGMRLRNCLRDDLERARYRLWCQGGRSRFFILAAPSGKTLALLCLDWDSIACAWVVSELCGADNAPATSVAWAVDEFLSFYNELVPLPYQAVA